MADRGEYLTKLGHRGLVLSLLSLVTAGMALADEQPETSSTVDDNGEDVAVRAMDEEEELSNWFLFLAASNLHPKLDETEDLIEKLINNGLGSVCPRWEDPETFSDWRDEFRLWEVMAGVGYHLSPKWAWYIATGFVRGTTQKETNMFPLFLPVKTEVEFTRSVIFITSGLDYYPWGKSVLPPKREGESRIMRRLRGARPYGELATGYVHIRTKAPVTIANLGGENLIRYNKTAVYDMTYLSPRLGVDFPLTDRDTFAFQAGYLFFDKHKDEYNNASYYFIYKHRF